MDEYRLLDMYANKILDMACAVGFTAARYTHGLHTAYACAAASNTVRYTI